MSDDLAIDENLVHRLPLPLAQLYRRAHNANSSQERHQAAYFLWEAALKLLASAAVVQYVALDRRDPQIEPKLESLSRPAVGHWWQFVRLLVPLLAEAEVPRYAVLRDMLLGRTRDDLPRAAGLDCLLSATDPLHPPARSTVSLSELFHRLVSYRNREIGHGAAGMRREAIYDRYGRALLAGLAQVLQQLDVLAGGRLLFIDDVSRQPSGGWLVTRYELLGETPQRLESLELPETMTSHLPRPQQVYLELPDARAPVPGSLGWLSLHPLVIYDDETREVFFLNGAQGQRQANYLSYTSGAQSCRDALAGDQRRLLAHVLGREVADDELSAWAARSQADDPPPPETDMPGQHRMIGEFELLSELGHGGMGIVYRAFQPSLGRQVALKCLQRVGDPKAEQRFAREIRVLGRVDHPHLVKIHTF